jgi:hypothetical protein
LYNDGTATITNSTISDNTSSGSGGGITNGNYWLRSRFAP